MTLEFSQTNWLRFLSILILGVANTNLLLDSWFGFLICIAIAAFFEWCRFKLHQTLTHQYFAGIEKAKEAERERKAKIVEEVKRMALKKVSI